MKKVFTLLLLLTALLSEAPQSSAQVIYSQNFDSIAYFQRVPAGWTDSIFNWQLNSSDPEGYPTWYQSNLPGDPVYCYDYTCTSCVYPGEYSYYDPLPSVYGSTIPGPYGTVFSETDANPAPSSHSGSNSNCGGDGYISYMSYENAYANYDAVNYYGGTFFPFSAELASPAMNFNTAYQANGGLGTIRLSFWMQTGYEDVTATNQVKVYINTSPVSAGATLIDSIYPYGETQFPLLYGYEPQWALFQYTLPASYYTSSNVYIIFKGSVSTNTSSYYSTEEDLDIDDFAVTYIPPCDSPTVQPTNMRFATSASIVSDTFTAPVPAPSGYLVVRSLSPFVGYPVNSTTYSLGAPIGANGTIVALGNATTFRDSLLSPGTNYTYTVFAYSSGDDCSITYDKTAPLINSVTTGGINTYTWNRATTSNFNTATNWTPSRVVPDPTDILVFNNGISDTATNVPLQGVGRLSLSNNTQLHMRSSASGNTFTVNLNGVANAPGVDIGFGSGLILDGSSALVLAFGPGSTPNIAGNLEVANNADVNMVNFTNATASIAATGQLAAGGTNNNYPFVIPTASSLTINGTYNNKYTTIGGFIANPATWTPSSTVLISGYTTATSGPSSGLNQTFPNFTYNAPNQTSACNWNGSQLNVTGIFNITSTGTGSWVLAGTQPYSSTVNSFVQAGGTLDLSNGANSGAATQVLNITGTFNQLGAPSNIISSGTGTTQPILFFNGTGGQQSVTMSNSPLGPVVYRIGNSAGIHLIGINTLNSTPILSVNSGGGVRISTTAANPINTTLLLQYATANSTLTFDTSGNITATAPVWPSSTPPFNVVINVNTGNAVKVPFNATIPGALTFLSGDIDMSTFNLTIGNSTLSTNQGSIIEPTSATPYYSVLGNGNVRLTTGSLTRWFGTAGLPLTPFGFDAISGMSSQGYYPIAFGGSNRNASVYFSAANALGSGGTITVSHNSATGTSSFSVIDPTPPSYTMSVRTNASWTFSTGNLLALNTGATFGINLTAGNLINPINSFQMRLTHQTSDPGTNGGTGSSSAPNFTASRNGLAGTDLTASAWFFGSAAADISTGTNGVYTAITTGNWTTASNWDIGAVPGANNVAVINPGVTTTVNTATCVAKALTVMGTLNDNTSGNSLKVDSQLINNGVVNVNGGTLLLNSNGTANAVTLSSFVGIYNYGNFTINGGTVGVGPTGGGNKPFLSYGGLSVGPSASSKLTVNGVLDLLGGSFFTQTNGNIIVDGNAGGVLANSAPHGRAMFTIATTAVNLYGGNITIVDPPTDPTTVLLSGPGAAFEYVVPTATVFNDSSAHTFTFGDSVSTDPGGTTGGFRIKTISNSGLFNFSNVVIRGAAGVNRAVTAYPGEPVGIRNSLIINNGGEYQTLNQNLVLNGNITVNAGGKLTTDNSGILAFGRLGLSGTATVITPAAPVVSPQKLSGNGVFVNASTPAANLGKILDMSPPYVVFNTGTNLIIPSADNINFTPINGVPSRIIMATGNLAETGASGTSNNASATNGWVVGGYQKHAAVGNMSSSNFLYPIGDSTRYTPVVLSGTGSNVTSAGDIAVSTQPFYSVNLASSSFNPLQILNRIYTITTTPSLVIKPYSVQASFKWVPSDVSPSANPQSFKIGVNPIGNIWYYPHSTVTSPTSINLDSLAPTGLAGVYQVGEACPPTVISSQPVSSGGCVGGLPVTFSVTATGASLAYQWYHNNVPIPNANGPVYTRQVPGITDSGTYYVVISGACALPDTSTKVQFVIGGAPPITVQPLSEGVCAGYPVTLHVTALNASTYRWQKNDVDVPGTLAANSANLTINSLTVLDTGRYRVIVGNGCAYDTSLIAVISILPLPGATITTTTPLAFCAGGNVLLNANIAPGYTYQWSLDGNTIGGAVNAVYAATGSGNYSVAVSDANSCTSISTSDSVTVFPGPPVHDSVIGSTTFCTGGSVQLMANYDPSYIYHWQLNGIDIPGATATTDSFTATASGNYSIAVTNLQNCTTTSPAILVTSLTVPSGPVSLSGTTSLCTGNSVLLTAPAGVGYTYQWFNNNATINGANNISYTANATGSYTAIVSNGYCVDTTAPVSVTLNPLPANTISVTGATTFCQGGEATLSAGTGTGLTYQWQNNGSNIQANDATYAATATGSYSVVITNSANCTETTTPVSITVSPLPVPVVTYNAGVLSTQPIFTSYQWFENGNPVPANDGNPTYTATSKGIYTVYVIGNNGCSNMSAPFNYNGEGVINVGATHVRVYPNPARDVVYIDAPFTVNVSVNGLDGKELFNKSDAKSLNIAELANGIYMIRISDADGNLISVEKLVKAEN